jgi:flagellar biogenesis protein FliO
MSCWTDSAESPTGQSCPTASPGPRPHRLSVRRLTFAIVWLAMAPHLFAQTGATPRSTRPGQQQVQANPTVPQEAFTPIENRGNEVSRPRTPINRQNATLTETPAVERSTRNPIWTTLGLLCLLLAGLYGVLRLLRRFGGRRFSAVESQQIQLVARQQLDSQTSVFLLRVGRRLILAGSSPSGLNSLAEIDDPEEVSELCGTEREADATSFSSLFTGVRPIRRETAPADLRTNDTTSDLHEASSPTSHVESREAWHA